MGVNYEQVDSCMRLFTSHGTVIFVDTASGELRHGLLESSPSNVVLVCEGDRGRIMFAGTDNQQEIACLPEYSAVVGSEKLRSNEVAITAGSVFTCVPTTSKEFGKEFGLTDRGKFLCAEPDGRITLFRTHCKDWESFHTRTDTSELSGTIVSYRIDGQMIHLFIANRRDWIQSHQCRGDFFEREALDLIKLYCRPERAFADIGANIGNHTIFVSKFCTVSDIIVFEPDPIAIKLLRVNLALNACLNVDTHYIGLALGSEAKQLRVFRPASDNLGGAQMVEEQQGDIRCVPGDEVLLSKPVGVIKIDVEGMEFDVLKGLHRTIERWRPNILIEVWPQASDALLAWCEQFNYKIIKRFVWDNYFLAPKEAGNSAMPSTKISP